MHLLDVTKSSILQGEERKLHGIHGIISVRLQPLFLSLLPKLEDITNHLASIERFVVLLNNRTSTISTVNECKKDLFARKGWPLEGIPPMSDAFMQHLKRALTKQVNAGLSHWSQTKSFLFLVFGNGKIVKMVVQQKRLGYSYTIQYCINIEKIATILCESRSNNRFEIK